MEGHEEGDEILPLLKDDTGQNHDANKTSSLQLLKSRATVLKCFVLGSPCNSSTIFRPYGGGGGRKKTRKSYNFIFQSSYNIVTCISDCRRGLNWGIDLLNSHKS
jgi:hypothetical protein